MTALLMDTITRPPNLHYLDVTLNPRESPIQRNAISLLLFFLDLLLYWTTGSWLAWVYRVMDARGRLLSTKERKAHEEIEAIMQIFPLC